MVELLQETWTHFGNHQHRFDPPDIYFSRMNGDVSAADMRAQLDALRSVHQKTNQGIFWLCDVRNIGTISAEARHIIAASSSTDLRHALRGSAVFGAAFSTRIVVTLVARAVRLLNPSKLRPVAFVDTEARA